MNNDEDKIFLPPLDPLRFAYLFFGAFFLLAAVAGCAVLAVSITNMGFHTFEACFLHLILAAISICALCFAAVSFGLFEGYDFDFGSSLDGW